MNRIEQAIEVRSQLLNCLQREMSRSDLMAQCGLTYEQVRRQTRVLSIEGFIESRIDKGKRLYRLRITAQVSVVS